MSGDKLNSLVDLAVFAAQHGMIWVGLDIYPGWAESTASIEDLNRLGSWLGAMAQSDADLSAEKAPPATDLRTAAALGARVATVTHAAPEGSTGGLMAWFVLLAAAAFEIAFALSLKPSEGFSRLWPTLGVLVFGVISVALLAKTLDHLPVGTAYAIWTGLGSVGVVTPRHRPVRRTDHPGPPGLHRPDRHRSGRTPPGRGGLGGPPGHHNWPLATMPRVKSPRDRRM